MSLLLDGRVARGKREEELRNKITRFWTSPTLAIIQIGNNAESTAYIIQKKKCADRIGAKVEHLILPNFITEQEVISHINHFNTDKNVHGIIVQLPIPATLSKMRIIETIDAHKDVDGLTSHSLKHLWKGDKSGFIPATAKGVMTLLDQYKISLEGKHVVILGRSELVGKPIALAALAQNATVTVCHSKTPHVEKITQLADVLIVAIGKPHHITPKFVKEGQVVVDVGINLVGGAKLEDEIANHKLVGDVQFADIKNIVAAISPVPGGVGPMTVVSLFENLVHAYDLQHPRGQ